MKLWLTFSKTGKPSEKNSSFMRGSEVHIPFSITWQRLLGYASELFSRMAHVITKKRKRISSDLTRMVAFLKYPDVFDESADTADIEEDSTKIWSITSLFKANSFTVRAIGKVAILKGLGYFQEVRTMNDESVMNDEMAVDKDDTDNEVTVLQENEQSTQDGCASSGDEVDLHCEISLQSNSPTQSFKSSSVEFPEMDEEYRAVTAALNSFYSFQKHQYDRVVKPKSIKYQSLSEDEKSLVPWIPNLVRDLSQCIEINSSFTQELATMAAQDWGIPADPSQWAQPSAAEYDKVRSTLLQMSREWSSDGDTERGITYSKLVRKACELVPESERKSTKILVPGCGLGRLIYEFVKCGFWTQGNEVSYHMLLASAFLLNRVTMPHSHTIFPYIHSSSHVTRRLFQVRPVSIPDETAASIFSNPHHVSGDLSELMSTTAGSFVDLYGPAGLAEGESYSQDPSAVEFRGENKEAFDIVSTCFFLDTAQNIIDYLKTIHHCLKSGGRWLNLGPLHWHFEGDSTSQIVNKVMAPGEGPVAVHSAMEGLELSKDELLQLIENVGFKIIEHEEGISTTYSSDVRASSKFVYECDFWVAEKI